MTRFADAEMGLVVIKWDFSVKLMYTMSTITGHDPSVLYPHTVIRDGSLRRCSNTSQHSPYCEFEILFRQDIAKALLVREDELDVTLVTASGLDSVIVTFRFIPLNETLFVVHWLDIKIRELVKQVRLFGPYCFKHFCQ